MPDKKQTTKTTKRLAIIDKLKLVCSGLMLTLAASVVIDFVAYELAGYRSDGLIGLASMIRSNREVVYPALLVISMVLSAVVAVAVLL